MGRKIQRFTGKKTNCIFKKIAAVAALAAALLIICFLTGRYGWKLFGFSFCQSAGIESISVSDGQVEIIGYDPSPFPEGFLGYYAEEKDGKLYVGFKFSGLFGIFEPGDFHITIPAEEAISQVYMRTEKNEYLIWDAEENVQ